jgi:hypothetical protein
MTVNFELASKNLLKIEDYTSFIASRLIWTFGGSVTSMDMSKL